MIVQKLVKFLTSSIISITSDVCLYMDCITPWKLPTTVVGDKCICYACDMKLTSHVHLSLTIFVGNFQVVMQSIYKLTSLVMLTIEEVFVNLTNFYTSLLG